MKDTLEIKIGERYRYHGKSYEIVDTRDDQVQMRSTDRDKSVIFQSKIKLQTKYNKGELVRTQEAPISRDNAQVLLSLPEKHQINLKRKLTYVDRILAEFSGRLPCHATKNLIASIAKEIDDLKPPAYSTIYIWLSAYKHSDRNPFSLLDPLCRKKNSRFDRQHPEIREALRYYLDALYLIKRPSTITDVIDAVQTSAKSSNHQRPAWDQIRIPSITTLYRLIKELDPLAVSVKQNGLTTAIRRHSWSKRFSEPLRLFDLAECDTHTVDIVAVDELGRPIGKPFLTIIILIKPRYVIGFDLSLNPPSVSKTVRAIKHSLASEREYTGQAAHYIMDNGPDFRSVHLRERLELIGAKLTYCEPRNPNQKPHVESWFKTLVVQFTHHLQGTTFSNLEERGDYDSEKEAVFTLEELRLKFEEWLEIYHSSFHRTLNMSPRRAWETMRDDQFPARRYSQDQLDGLFLSQTSSKVIKGRVRHNNLFWTGPGIARIGSLLKKNEEAIVLYDESDLGKAIVYHPRLPENRYIADAVDPTYQCGLTMYAHNLVRAKILKEAKRFSYREAKEARLRLNMELAQGKSKSTRRKRAILEDLQGIVDNFLDDTKDSPDYCDIAEEVDENSFLNESTTPTTYATVEVSHERRNRK
ncbi:DDE-type integrase/transposase/recombinase [Pseudomonas sp. TCU-HL1]|uniref:DDE-type integrase/transposase/recombinase n=1 Tax=Pseudomonas sp. TCU-HL1 TaxID=1856685 RepID=UPI0008589A82|nr:DDE-type integrase/transposase/recombinase [Pseudomonas sp. TCU-HL1]AOE86748.1 hypothetical protein THL1_4200 [Pseudomonas sp. TCU-HL1]